jgi:hypothetical protein
MFLWLKGQPGNGRGYLVYIRGKKKNIRNHICQLSSTFGSLNYWFWEILFG